MGELANFLMGGAMVYLAGMIYYKNHRSAWLACLTGAIGMAIMAAVTNYFILLPLFETFMPLDALIASFAEFIPCLLYTSFIPAVADCGYRAPLSPRLAVSYTHLPAH